MRLSIAFVLAALLSACGGGVDVTSEKGAGGEGFSADLPPSTSSPLDCPDEHKQVFVVSRERDLYRFAPATLAFTKIGALACPAVGAPVSMAVDRNGTAWVHYDDGGIYLASTADASCRASGFTVGQHGFRRWGMAFVGTSKEQEALYVIDNQKGLGTIDTASLKLAPVAARTGWAELTGTSDGRLFAFQSPQTLARVDRTSGAFAEVAPIGDVTAGWAFAFAHWGGHFWLFTAQPGKRSVVTQHDRDAGKSAVRVADVGFVVVGAGVSTCAPITGAPDVPR